MTWTFSLTHLKEPPSESVVDQTLADIRATASRLGFAIEGVIRGSQDALPESRPGLTGQRGPGSASSGPT